MYKLYYFLFIAILFTSCVNTKPPKDKDRERIDKVCDNFMSDFKDGKFEESMQLLKQNSVLDPSTVDTLQKQLLEQVKNGAFSAYGEVISYELIAEREVNNFAAKRYYALKLKKYFLRFMFTVYNNGNGWRIIHFKYDDKISELF